MGTSPSVPRLFLLSALLLVAGLALFAYNWSSYPVQFSLYVGMLVGAAVLSEHYAPTIRGHSASIALPLAVAALMLGGPCTAAVVAAASAIRRDSFETSRMRAISFFNFGQYAVIYGLAGLIYTRLGGPILAGDTMTHLRASDFPQALLPMGGAVVALVIGNVILTAVGIQVLYESAPLDALAGVLPHAPSLAALGFVGYLIAQVVASSALALPLFLFPLMLARQIYQRYAVMEEAYVDTVRSLVSALEAKDPYTRGHSVRVAEYAVGLGKRLGHDERTLDILEKSALLHDIGKLALSSAVLVKPTRLSDDEFAAMRRHPIAGAEMVDRIPPLRGLSPLLRQHHEWYDGTGYPTGLAHPEIHHLARILSIADAFDAMTTTRAYRPAMNQADALGELARGSGTQFDPQLIEPFIEVLSSDGGLSVDTALGATRVGLPEAGRP